jgi:hypothetical protein
MRRTTASDEQEKCLKRIIEASRRYSIEAHGAVMAHRLSPLLRSGSGSSASALRAVAWRLARRILSSFYEPEEGSCPSCCSIALVDVDHRPRCPASTPVDRRATKVCATRPTHQRSNRSSPS